MLVKWHFHQFSGYKRPYVWRIVGVKPSGQPLYEFVRGVVTRRSRSGKFGDFEFAINRPGLYKVGNTKDDNGYRFVFAHGGIWRYRALQDDADAVIVARKLQAGEAMQDVTDELIDQFNWHFPFRNRDETTQRR